MSSWLSLKLKMERNRLLVYERREMMILVLIGVMIAVFTFTLGVHLGRRSQRDLKPLVDQSVVGVAGAPDKIPGRQEFADQNKKMPNVVEESLNQALHEEVTKSGLKADSPRQVDLPEKPVSKNAGATTLKNPAKLLTEKNAALGREAPPGKYTLQVGSFQTAQDSSNLVKLLESKGESPFLRTVEIEGKGSWYRLYVGGFSSVAEAEDAGKILKDKKVIKSFIVANQIE